MNRQQRRRIASMVSAGNYAGASRQDLADHLADLARNQGLAQLVATCGMNAVLDRDGTQALDDLVAWIKTDDTLAPA